MSRSHGYAKAAQTVALQSGVNAKTTPSAESRKIVKELLEGAKL